MTTTMMKMMTTITTLLCFRYTGYCPQLRFKCGRTYGADTDKLTKVSKVVI